MFGDDFPRRVSDKAHWIKENKANKTPNNQDIIIQNIKKTISNDEIQAFKTCSHL